MGCDSGHTLFLFNSTFKNAMKTSITLLAVALLGAGLAQAQTTSYPSSTSTGSSTMSTGTYSTSPSTTNAYDSNTSGTMNSSGSTYGTATTNDRESTRDTDKPYKAFTGGFYAGVNSTRLRGESIPNGRNSSGRLGYQLGVFARGGGRLYGQLGVEYFASSSNFFNPNDGQTVTQIAGQIDQKFIQIPVLVGFKLVESTRGISAVRIAIGGEYANQLSSSNTVQINESEIKSGSFNALGQLGFDFGPVFVDLTYHHGLSNTINGFNNSQRRILGANLGFKF
jgi:hypothetical protein